MFSYARKMVEEAERTAQSGDFVQTLEALRALPLDDFGEILISMPTDEWPALSAILPRMAAEQVQLNWTGATGLPLLRATNNFVRLMTQTYEHISGRAVADARVLDFGCGYGRIMRAMYYFSNPEHLHGCDPWDKSIELCKQAGIVGNLAISDYLPNDLPFEGKFDLIYALSVFTHLSPRATKLCLSTLAKNLAPTGVLAITIRPVEYWDIDPRFNEAERRDLVVEHTSKGIAFSPHGRAAIDGDITYGDTSMSFDYLAADEPSLKITKIERTIDDPYQIIVFMTLR